MMKRLIAALTTTATLLTGCAAGLPGLRPITYQRPGETRVYASYAPCPHRAGDDFAPFLAAAALEIGSKLISGFGTALTKGAEGGALPASVATTNVEIGSELPKCLIVIRGRFSEQNPGEQSSRLPPTTQKMSLMNAAGTLVDVPMPTVYDLQHYAEIQLASSRNRTAMTFGPAIIFIARSMDGSAKGDRSVSIGVKFERPGHDAVGSAVLISNRRIGDDGAYDVDETRRMRYQAPWFATVASLDGPSAANAAGGSGSGTGQPPAAPGAGSQAPATPGPGAAAAGAANGPIPYTITATIIETRPTKAFLAFVASVFTGLEPALNQELKDRIDPATRTAAAGTTIDHDSAYTTALAGAQTALLGYCPLPGTTARADLISKSAAARVAQLAANKAALAADVAAPFPQLVEVGSDDPAGVAACASYK